MAKRYYLYKFEDNWAEEADFSGFAIMSDMEKERHQEGIKRAYKNGGTICFGTNEDNEYDSYEEVCATFKFKEITEEEYLTIKKLFGKTFGELGPLDVYFDYESDEDDVCGECGGYDDTGDDLCSDCQEEEDREKEENKEAIEQFKEEIEEEFGIEANSKGNYSWKPTPITNLEIEFEGDNGYVNIMLKKGSKLMDYEYVYFTDDNLIAVIKKLIRRAQNL